MTKVRVLLLDGELKFLPCGISKHSHSSYSYPGIRYLKKKKETSAKPFFNVIITRLCHVTIERLVFVLLLGLR